LLGAVGVKLNTVLNDLGIIDDNLERHAIAKTGVDSGRRIAWELEGPSDELGFG